MIIDSGVNDVITDYTNDKRFQEILLTIYSYIDQKSSIYDDKYMIELSSKTTKNKWNFLINGKVHNFSTITKILEELNLININHSYKTGERNKHYGTKIDHIKREFINVPSLLRISPEKKIATLKKKQPKDFQFIDQINKIREDLLKNEEAIFAAINEMLKKGELKKASSAAAQVNAIIAGEYFVTHSKSGRIYTNASNLPTFIYKVLYPNYLEIDTANSQPLHLSSLIKSKKLKNDVENGVFYEKIKELFNLPTDERKLIKKWTYKHILFSTRELSGNILNKLNEEYDGMGDQLNKLQKGNKIWFALQNKESKMWVPTAEKYMNLGYHIIFKHDGIIAPMDAILDIYLEQKEKYNSIGLAAKLNIGKIGEK